jgi:hypothetical protein
MSRAYDNGRRGTGRARPLDVWRQVERLDGLRRQLLPLSLVGRMFGVDFGSRGGGEGLVAAQRGGLVRRSRTRLGESLTPIQPISGAESNGFGFNDLFLDRRRRPDLMRRGYSAAREALAPFRRRRRA